MYQMEFQFPEKNKNNDSIYEWLISNLSRLTPSSYYYVPDGRHGYRKVYRNGSST